VTRASVCVRARGGGAGRGRGRQQGRTWEMCVGATGLTHREVVVHVAVNQRRLKPGELGLDVLLGLLG